MGVYLNPGNDAFRMAVNVRLYLFRMQKYVDNSAMQ